MKNKLDVATFPGKATHFRPAGASAAACGRPWVAFATDDRARVDCRQCRRALRSAPSSGAGH